jgi:hypothetical protein
LSEAVRICALEGMGKSLENSQGPGGQGASHAVQSRKNPLLPVGFSLSPGLPRRK